MLITPDPQPVDTIAHYHRGRAIGADFIVTESALADVAAPACGEGPAVPYPEQLPLTDSPAFFRRVGDWVHTAIDAAFPRTPALAVRATGVSPGSASGWSDAEFAALQAAFVGPIWSLVERGGKCWRPYLAALACEAVGGDARILWPHVITMLELVQVGSLIVDDVEDGSAVRRNGPACHLVHGVARAVNAGTLCYLLAPPAFGSLPLPEPARHQLLRAYVEMLAAAHVGQALDIESVADGLPDLVASGDAAPLLERIRTIHRLKTGRFVGFMARAGALSGRASEVQVDRLERYGLAVGCAFQALDDVSNLRGFASDLRPFAEDLTHGKVTLPVVLALGRLSPARRRWLADLLVAHVTDREQLALAVRTIEDTGALRDCIEDAEREVRTAAADLLDCLAPSRARTMLLEFGLELLRDRR